MKYMRPWSVWSVTFYCLFIFCNMTNDCGALYNASNLITFTNIRDLLVHCEFV